MEKISIIIPVYNVEKYLARCLESIINQTHTNLEIICINDGSPDSSLEILKKYEKQDKRIKIIDKRNGGVSSARNSGIRVMTGEYVLFVDADDWLEEQAIEKLCQIIKKENVDLVRGNYFTNVNETQSVKQKGVEKIFKTPEEFKQTFFLDILKGTLPGYACLFLIKTSIIKKNNIFFNEKIHFMEDMLFIVTLLTQIDSVYFSDFAFYHYFVNDSGATRSSDKYMKNIECMVEVFKKTREVLSENDLDEYIEIRKNANIKSIMSYVYLMFKNSKDKEDFVNNMNIILSKSDVYELMKDGNLLLLNKNIKNYIENKLYKLLLKRKYNTLYMLYKLRKKLENIKHA